MAESLPPILRGVLARLRADEELQTLAPGGIHFRQSPQDGELPCVLVWLPDAIQSVAEFGRTAYEDATVRVMGVDEDTSPTRAQQIADRCNVVLADAPLTLDAPWRWMATFRAVTHVELIDEADLRYQQRGASYHVLACPDVSAGVTKGVQHAPIGT